jgi:hypothetical protein
MAQPAFLPPVEVLSVETITDLAEVLPHRHNYFTLLLAWDIPEIEPGRLIERFRPLVDRGLVYFCAWGDQCEMAHDAVDYCVVESELEVGKSGHLTMTTWHDDEPLAEAIWFFRMLAIPTENHVFADFEQYAIAVANPLWAGEMIQLVAAAAAPSTESG